MSPVYTPKPDPEQALARMLTYIETLETALAEAREALIETLPRYIELFELTGLGKPEDSVAVGHMRAAITRLIAVLGDGPGAAGAGEGRG